ncbi:MAG: hypothetical protein KAJ78_10385, partial [Acidobacteria bacterium]|nr:hypothetical protein [Acidobacteriota bacterium]
GETWTLDGITNPPTLLLAVSQAGTASYVTGSSGTIFRKTDRIFSDGFESGDTDYWSGATR